MRKVNLYVFVAVTILALTAGLWLGRSQAAALATPGSEQDPLVTKSYVAEAVAEATAPLLARLAALEKSSGQPSPGEQPAPGEETPILAVVSVPAGGKLVAYEGTEFILRSGKAAVVGSPAGGIPDLTLGKDLPGGSEAPANHLLLFPRSDGRGLKATTAIIVMVRGSYTVEEK